MRCLSATAVIIKHVWQCSRNLSNRCRTAVRQTRIFCRTKQNSAGQEARLLANYYLFLPEITGHLSDKLKFSAGQNKNLPVLSDSPTVFVKTGMVIPQNQNLYEYNHYFNSDGFNGD